MYRSCIYLEVKWKLQTLQIATISHNNQHAKRIPLKNKHLKSDVFYLTLFKIK